MSKGFSAFPVTGIPLVMPGDSISKLIMQALAGNSLDEGDIVVVCHTIVSKSEGNVHRLDQIECSQSVSSMATQMGEKPAILELALRSSRRVVRMSPDSLVCETKHGFVCVNGGVDQSNAPEGCALTLPEDPDLSAQNIRDELLLAANLRKLAVVITDTFGRPYRKGTTNVSIGSAGICPLTTREDKDLYGRDLIKSTSAYVDQVASAAGLIMGEGNEGVPVVVLRGLEYEECSGRSAVLVRGYAEELFR